MCTFFPPGPGGDFFDFVSLRLVSRSSIKVISELSELSAHQNFFFFFLKKKKKKKKLSTHQKERRLTLKMAEIKVNKENESLSKI